MIQHRNGYLRNPMKQHRLCTPQASLYAEHAESAQSVKELLLEALLDTDRGGNVTSLQRGKIEELQLQLEISSPPALDFSKLRGKWLLLYTTASDVLPLVRGPPSLFQSSARIGNIYQRFSTPEIGKVENIIEATVTLPLLPSVGLVFVVAATYVIRTAKSICLSFKAAGLEEIQLSPELQNLVAPAALPRGFWNQRLLMALQGAKLSVPLSGHQVLDRDSSKRRPVGINYSLTYLDDEVLVGRAQANGGSFIFRKSQ